jgi:hypothetical protein
MESFIMQMRFITLDKLFIILSGLSSWAPRCSSWGKEAQFRSDVVPQVGLDGQTQG